MTRICFALLALSSLAWAQPKMDGDFPLVKAEECRPRSGLPNFLAKANTKGAEVKVAYLGGSITAQPGWRVKTLEHFQKTWPEAKFSEVNAAIGGTGSDLGVCRLQQDVLRHKPDLLFVEFAVNDGGAVTHEIQRCMEGIVRQTWTALPDCDICFVYTVTESLVKHMLEGWFQRSASAMEGVAQHYGIPSIHMGMEVAALAREGKLEWKAKLPKTDEEKKTAGNKFIFAPDGVHPHVETGHQLYLEAVVRSLAPITDASGKPARHVLAAPFDDQNYEKAQLLPISAVTLTEGFTLLDAEKDEMGKRWANRMTSLHKAAKAGEKITFKFKGPRCAIYQVIGPDVGKVKLTLDGVVSERTLFDSYCTYPRLSTLLVGVDLAPDEVHEVEIELLKDAPDKAKILSQRNETIDKPERYADNHFYPGALLLVGELVKE